MDYEKQLTQYIIQSNIIKNIVTNAINKNDFGFIIKFVNDQPLTTPLIINEIDKFSPEPSVKCFVDIYKFINECEPDQITQAKLSSQFVHKLVQYEVDCMLVINDSNLHEIDPIDFVYSKQSMQVIQSNYKLITKLYLANCYCEVINALINMKMYNVLYSFIIYSHTNNDNNPLNYLGCCRLTHMKWILDNVTMDGWFKSLYKHRQTIINNYFREIVVGMKKCDYVKLILTYGPTIKI